MKSGVCCFAAALPVVLALLPGCALTPYDELSFEMLELYRNPPSERIELGEILQPEGWKHAFGGPYLNSSITEFTRPPETVENWTELLTLEVFWRTNRVYDDIPGAYSFTVVPAVGDFMEHVKARIQERATEPIGFDVLEQDEDSVTFYIACPRFQDGTAEAQVHRVLRGEKGLFHVFMIRRTAALDEKTRRRFADSLGRAYIRDDAPMN